MRGKLFFMAWLYLGSLCASEDLMTELMPLMLKLMSSSETQLQQTVSKPEVCKKTASLLPEAVVLKKESPEQQTGLLVEAIESALLVHQEEFLELIETHQKSCLRRKEPSCQQKAHLRACRPLVDLLVDYAERWGLDLESVHREMYWGLIHQLVLKQLQEIYPTLQGQQEISRYLQNKIRLKKQFAL